MSGAVAPLDSALPELSPTPSIVAGLAHLSPPGCPYPRSLQGMEVALAAARDFVRMMRPEAES
jgi:hypothetical protein